MTTEWIKDPPPKGSTSMRVGCIKANVAIVGDSSQCVNECNAPPDVAISEFETHDTNVPLQGFN